MCAFHEHRKCFPRSEPRLVKPPDLAESIAHLHPRFYEPPGPPPVSRTRRDLESARHSTVARRLRPAAAAGVRVSVWKQLLTNVWRRVGGSERD